MKVTEAEFVKGFIRLCDDGFKQNWHERNGGNLSYRIKPEEVESVKEELTDTNPWPVSYTHLDVYKRQVGSLRTTPIFLQSGLK